MVFHATGRLLDDWLSIIPDLYDWFFGRNNIQTVIQTVDSPVFEWTWEV